MATAPKTPKRHVYCKLGMRGTSLKSRFKLGSSIYIPLVNKKTGKTKVARMTVFRISVSCAYRVNSTEYMSFAYTLSRQEPDGVKFLYAVEEHKIYAARKDALAVLLADNGQMELPGVSS